jgi:ferritin-like metal-binding protein YciE
VTSPLHTEPSAAMSQSATEQLSAWLNSAYAMEESLVQILENHVNDAKDQPEIRDRLEQHLSETRRHVEQVRQCLDLLGETPSTMKSMLGNFVGMLQGASTGIFRDELMKNCLMDFAAENFEIACYRALLTAAEELERPEIANICLEILRDEEAMALWLEERIPAITRITLQQLTNV